MRACRQAHYVAVKLVVLIQVFLPVKWLHSLFPPQRAVGRVKRLEESLAPRASVLAAVINCR